VTISSESAATAAARTCRSFSSFVIAGSSRSISAGSTSASSNRPQRIDVQTESRTLRVLPRGARRRISRMRGTNLRVQDAFERRPGHSVTSVTQEVIDRFYGPESIESPRYWLGIAIAAKRRSRSDNDPKPRARHRARWSRNAGSTVQLRAQTIWRGSRRSPLRRPTPPKVMSRAAGAVRDP
jgi:hypothetical protein